MKTILKYRLEWKDVTRLDIPGGGIIRHVGMQGKFITLWIEVDTDTDHSREREFVFRGTGAELPEVENVHVGTVFDGNFVWHIRELL